MALLEASAPRAARRSLALRWVFPAVSFAVDLILINLAFAVAYWLRYKFGIGGHVLGQNNVRYEYWLHFEILLTVLMAASFALAGTYRQRLGMEWLGEVFAVGRAATVGMALAIIVTYLSKNLIDEHSRLVLLYTWILDHRADVAGARPDAADPAAPAPPRLERAPRRGRRFDGDEQDGDAEPERAARSRLPTRRIPARERRGSRGIRPLP